MGARAAQRAEVLRRGLPSPRSVRHTHLFGHVAQAQTFTFKGVLDHSIARQGCMSTRIGS